jgi:exopolysaccharide biosynthesis polyprenyl glycosylphosphotransferase
MLRRDRQIRMQIHQLMDACLFAVSFWMAYELRTSPAVTGLLHLPDFSTEFEYYMWLYLVLIPAAPFVLEAQGFYTRPLLCRQRTTAWMLFKACSLVTVGLVLVLYAVRMTALARLMVIWFGFISFALIFIKEELLRLAFRSRFAQTQFCRRLVLVGSKDETARMRGELDANSQEETDVLAELDLNHTPLGDLVELLHEASVNAVILSGRHCHFERVEEVIRACELEGVEVWLVADFVRTQISRTSYDDFYGRPVLVFRTTPDASWQGVLKQLLDFTGAVLLLVLLSPFLLLFALVIKLTSPGPILFKQKRSGLNGRPFTIYKFRTMVTNAEQLQHELAAMNEMSGPVFKLSNDPRTTPAGRFFRRFSIDELPQLYNVLRGEMSLVGPRPLPVAEVKRFDDLAHRRRLSVKPGLTCLWQIRGRNDVKDFRDWVRLDLEYIDNWSFWLDLKILWLTVPVVLTGAGAK